MINNYLAREAYRTRVKYCGMTREVDAQFAEKLGVDAIGLIFYQKSPRFVSLEQAIKVKQVLSPLVSTVALFVNPTSIEVDRVLKYLQPTLLQFHGEESPEFCNSFGHPYIKAFRVDQSFDWSGELQKYHSAEAFLFDSKVEGGYGGSGRTFDWSLLESSGRLKHWSILAGGLDAANVSKAILKCRPEMVDVSGGIEEKPGIKSAEKMTKFMHSVMRSLI